MYIRNLQSSNMSKLMEEREELVMVPFAEKVLTSRKAHFLKPITSFVESVPSNPLSSHNVVQTPKKGPFKVLMKGGCPQKNWKKWVDELIPLYKETWEKAGILEAILGSTYEVKKHRKLVIALAERWCVETNTFVFPWGEATVTLEDLMVLGGFSVLGKHVLSPLGTDDLVETYYMIEAYCAAKRGTYTAWMEYFMGKGGEVEHVAFLVLWLSRYVFPIRLSLVAKNVFPVAVHLSKGEKIALGPAVLASIYKDLGLLKRLMVAFRKKKGCRIKKENVKLTVCSPLYFVQLWAWERFPKLRPNPCVIKHGEPRLARWHKIEKLKVEKVGELIDCSGGSFQWRPYAVSLTNREFDKWYNDNELYVLVDSEMETDVEHFVRFVRVSELVGLDCIEQYSPHRVAMQFGFDQDIPGCVWRENETCQIAWSYYNRPVESAYVYIPPRLHEAGVSTRYFEWWYPEELVEKDAPKKCRKLPEVYCMKEESSHVLAIQNLGSSNDIALTEDRLIVDYISNDDEDELSISKFLSLRKKQKVCELKISGDTLVQCSSLAASEVYYMKEEEPSHLLDKQNLGSSNDIALTEDRLTVDIISSDEEDELSISEFLSLRKKQKVCGLKISGETLVQCGSLVASVSHDELTSTDQLEIVKYSPPSTGTPMREIDTQGHSGNLDHWEGVNNNSRDVEGNGLTCDAQKFVQLVEDQTVCKRAAKLEESKTLTEDGNGSPELESMEQANLSSLKFCTLVEDQAGCGIKLPEMFETETSNPRSMDTTNLNKSSNGKGRQIGISFDGSAVTATELESRLRSLEVLVKDLWGKISPGGKTGNSSQLQPVEGSIE